MFILTNKYFFFLLKNISREILNNGGKTRWPNLLKFSTDLICDGFFENFFII